MINQEAIKPHEFFEVISWRPLTIDLVVAKGIELIAHIYETAPGLAEQLAQARFAGILPSATSEQSGGAITVILDRKPFSKSEKRTFRNAFLKVYGFEQGLLRVKHQADFEGRLASRETKMSWRAKALRDYGGLIDHYGVPPILSSQKIVTTILTRSADQRAAMPYKEYLKTEHWFILRWQAIVRAGYRCQVCSKPHDLQVHHRTYERRGNENLDDLTVLCGRCHHLFHKNAQNDWHKWTS